MPAKAQWLLQIPEIRKELQVLTVPVVDRETIERLFGLKRRRAIELMHVFGGYQAGRTFLIDRPELLTRLEQMERGDDFTFEKQRNDKISAAFDQMRKHRVVSGLAVRIAPETVGRSMKELPSGVRLEKGKLSVEFSSAEELLGRLYAFSRAAANDFDGFQEAIGME